MGDNLDQAASLRQRRPDAARALGKQALRCIAVASGKGGVGKTVFTVNLALALQDLGQRVLLVDSDFGLANADILLGLHPERTLQDAMFDGVDLAEIIVTSPHGVDLLPAGSGSRELVALGEARLQVLVTELIRCASAYDVVLFDCAAGISAEVLAIVAGVPQTIVVTTPQPTALVDAYAMLKIIHQDGLNTQVSLVFNMVEGENDGREAYQRLMNVMRAHANMDVQFLGAIPNEPEVSHAVRCRKPLIRCYPEAASTRRLSRMARAIVQQQHRTSRLDDLDAQGLLKAMLRKGS